MDSGGPSFLWPQWGMIIYVFTVLLALNQVAIGTFYEKYVIIDQFIEGVSL